MYILENAYFQDFSWRKRRVAFLFGLVCRSEIFEEDEDDGKMCFAFRFMTSLLAHASKTYVCMYTMQPSIIALDLEEFGYFFFVLTFF